MPRAAALLAGLIAGLGAGQWLDPWSSGVLSMVQAVGVLASATVAALATAMGGLMVSDWQADVESRSHWAQLRLTSAEVSTPAQERTAWDIDPSYQTSAINEALLVIFRAHRSVQPVAPESVRAVVGDRSTPPPASGHANHSDELSRAGVRRQVLSRHTVGNNVPMLPAFGSLRVAKFHVKRRVLPAPLVANGLPWQEWVAHEPSARKRVTLFAGSTAEIITLSSSEDVQAQRPAEAERVTDLAAEVPSCRGPPSLKQRRSTRGAAPTVGRAGAVSSALGDGNLLVRDDLGHPVPVCATEIDVIETYLGDILEDLFPSTRTSPKPERA